MEKNFSFAVEDIQRINLSEYEDDEFAVAKMGYLSTKPNSHGLKISEKVLRESASTVLNKWLVADMTRIVDAGTHTKEQKIVGRIPKEQDIEFVYDDDGYLRAYVDVVISKIYAKDFCKIFEEENNRAVSVEMRVLSNEDDESLVESFKIVGVTTLGKQIRPSCPDSDIEFTRFSEEDADKFFAKVHSGKLTALKKFVEDRKRYMEESKTYKIDKSKEAMSDKAWGEVDKTELRNKVMSAKNKSTLVKAVYMLVEDGWEEAPSEHLKYPVMELKGDTFIYNKGGLSSALGYARKENETAVVNKIEKIYKNLGLDQDGKEEGAKMAEKNANFEIEGRKAWGEVIKKVQDHEGKGAYVDSIEDNHIIYTKDNVRYRVEADVKVDKDDKSVDADIKWGTVKKDANQKMSDDCDYNNEHNHDDDDENEVEMSADEMKAEMAKMKSEIEDRDNIIMEKDKKMGEMEKELSELREFKKTCMEKEKAVSVDAVMNEVKEYMEDEQFKNLRDEGLACEFSQIDAWSNKVKAFCFEKGRKTTKSNSTIMAFSTNFDYSNKKKPNSVWETL